MSEGNGSAPAVKTCHRSIGGAQTPCVREACMMFVQLSNGQHNCLEVQLAAAQLNQVAIMEQAMRAQMQPTNVLNIDPRRLRAQ